LKKGLFQNQRKRQITKAKRLRELNVIKGMDPNPYSLYREIT